MVRAVVFDVGETLIDESREYGIWADRLGVPRHTFIAVLGAVIAQGLDYREAFRVFDPGFDLDHERRIRIVAGAGERFEAGDLYPDARAALTGLREVGVLVGIAGNQTSGNGENLRGLGLSADFVATSEDWGVRKPDVGFFDKVVESVGAEAEQIVYVGDRIDNDLVPARQRGLRTAHIQRGPWGWIAGRESEADELSDWRIHGLDELIGIVAGENGCG